MIVVKRDGREQEFTQRKISTSILNASDEIGQSMNRGDIKNVGGAIEKTISTKFDGRIHAADLHMIVLKTLDEFGFAAVAKAYDGSHEKY